MYIFIQVLVQYFFHDYYMDSILHYDTINRINTPWYYKILQYQLYKIKLKNNDNPITYYGYILILCPKNKPIPGSPLKVKWINNYFSCLPLYVCN